MEGEERTEHRHSWPTAEYVFSSLDLSSTQTDSSHQARTDQGRVLYPSPSHVPRSANTERETPAGLPSPDPPGRRRLSYQITTAFIR